jgi:ribosomal-protein-alanine N-acetyltransferase
MAARPTRACRPDPKGHPVLPPLDDVDRIMEVMAAAFPAEYGEAWNRRQVSDALLLAGTHYGLIAPDAASTLRADDQAAGFYLSRGLFDEEELLLFAIAPESRRRGLGHALLGQFIESVRSRGKKRIFLEMRRNNPAGILYANHGFRPVGIRPGYYRTSNGDRIDAITQELVIE